MRCRIVKTCLWTVLKVVGLLLAVSLVAFVLVYASPVKPVQQYILGLGSAVSEEQRQAIMEYWGMGQPPLQRYLHWLWEVLHGNFGTSLLYRRSVLSIIKERAVNSGILMLSAWVFSGCIGFLLGCIMGAFEDTVTDRILKKICYVVSSLPTFWVGILFLLVFSVCLHWFPIGFSSPIGVTSEQVTLSDRVYHALLPALTLSFTSFSSIALHTREKLVEVMHSEYVSYARSQGESLGTIVLHHGIRNILLPALTLQFTSFAELFGGSVLAENVFSYPGLGSAISQAGLNGDVPLLLGITLFSALFVCTGNGIADVLYGIIHPEIREGEQE